MPMPDSLILVMPLYIDQTGSEVEIIPNPSRIISLVPSQTELLADLELDDEVVGITKFCVHPSNWFRNKDRIGGTKNVNIEKVRALSPQLVIANKEENTREEVEAIRQFAPVWVSDIRKLQDALDMIMAVGIIVGKPLKAMKISELIKIKFGKLSGLSSTGLKSAYLIWQNPLMTIGGDSFINDMMMHCGFKNLFQDRLRYPQTSVEELTRMRPDLLLLSSEPFPFGQRHVIEWKEKLPHSRVVLVDGQYFSWYGSRLLKAPSYFQNLIQQIENQH